MKKYFVKKRPDMAWRGNTQEVWQVWFRTSYGKVVLIANTYSFDMAEHLANLLEETICHVCQEQKC